MKAQFIVQWNDDGTFSIKYILPELDTVRQIDESGATVEVTLGKIEGYVKRTIKAESN